MMAYAKHVCGYCGYHKDAHATGTDLSDYPVINSSVCGQYRTWNGNSATHSQPYIDAAEKWLLAQKASLTVPASVPKVDWEYAATTRLSSQCKCDIKDLLSTGHTSGCAYAT